MPCTFTLYTSIGSFLLKDNYVLRHILWTFIADIYSLLSHLTGWFTATVSKCTTLLHKSYHCVMDISFVQFFFRDYLSSTLRMLYTVHVHLIFCRDILMFLHPLIFWSSICTWIVFPFSNLNFLKRNKEQIGNCRKLYASYTAFMCI